MKKFLRAKNAEKSKAERERQKMRKSISCLCSVNLRYYRKCTLTVLSCKLCNINSFNSTCHRVQWGIRHFCHLSNNTLLLGHHRWLSGSESACQAGDMGSVPGSRRSPGEGNDNPLQYSCLGNPMDRGARGATVHGGAKSRTLLSNWKTTVFDLATLLRRVLSATPGRGLVMDRTLH